jgi:hypothetical protein
VFDLEERVLLPSRHVRAHLRKQSGSGRSPLSTIG